MKLLKLGESGAGSIEHKSIFLRQKILIKKIFSILLHRYITGPSRILRRNYQFCQVLVMPRAIKERKQAIPSKQYDKTYKNVIFKKTM